MHLDLTDLRNTGTFTSVLKLGSGDDVITGATNRGVQGLELGTAEGALAVNNFDIVVVANAVQASDVAATATITVKDGLLTFNGAGPSTLTAAVALAATAAESVNETVVFTYLGDSYIYNQGATVAAGDDVVVKLVGTTTVHGIDTVNATAGQLYVF